MRHNQFSRKYVALIVVLCLVTAGILASLLLKQGPISDLAGRIILLAGDSRSSTDYPFYKEILEKKTDSIVLMEGASGQTAAYNASDKYLARVTDKGHDFSIWLVGGNDDGSAGSVGTFSADSALGRLGEPVVSETDITQDYSGGTFIQAVDHIMRKYKAAYAGKASAPIMIFCTDLSQQRYDKDSPWSKRENWERKRLAIIECCEKNQIPCLDLYTLCYFDMKAEPMFNPPTDKENDRGVYFMDGLHPNRKGVDLITDFEISEMKRLLANNHPE